MLWREDLVSDPKIPRAERRLRSAYEAIGLGEREIEVISEAVPRRDYFLTSPEGSRLFRLELSPLELALYGVSRPPQIQAVRELREAHGDGEWVARWLESQDLPDEAAELRRLAAERKT